MYWAAVPVWRAGIRLDGGSDTGRHSGPIGAVMVRKKVTAACGAALKHFTATMITMAWYHLPTLSELAPSGRAVRDVAERWRASVHCPKGRTGGEGFMHRLIAGEG